ncbi:MAG: hypothetical protein KatS3mg081_0122 [Gemmatimonadales bacterium]|nr:MAG: hypothetical protein KatS3mg081_0122 [Gemmatimonadales bacterium]
MSVYFPRGQKSFGAIRKKFQEGVNVAKRRGASGIAFVTNQELKLSERAQLLDDAAPLQTDLFHLERLASILNSPANYGIRLEFLDIEMTKEEQVAYMALMDQDLRRVNEELLGVVKALKRGGSMPIPSEPLTVAPILSRSTLDAVFGDIPHKCSYCGFGFIVKDVLFDPMQLQAAACPKCGNVDRIQGLRIF